MSNLSGSASVGIVMILCRIFPVFATACVRREDAGRNRDYRILQRLCSEAMVSIAVPTTGIVLSMRAGNLQSLSVR